MTEGSPAHACGFFSCHSAIQKHICFLFSFLLVLYPKLSARAAEGADPGPRRPVDQALGVLADHPPGSSDILRDVVVVVVVKVRLVLASVGVLVLVILEDPGGDVMSNAVLLGGALRGRCCARD